MSQNAERAAALKKMRTYAAQTTDRGRTEGEMEIAMRELQKLGKAFNISLDELKLKDEPCVSRSVDTGSRVDLASNTCARAVAEFTGCIYYRSSGDRVAVRDANGEMITQTITRKLRNGRTKTIRRFKMTRGNTNYVFYGLESDVEMAEFLFKLIQNSIESETRRYKKTTEYREHRGPKKSASHSFQHGMASRISARLEEMTDQMRVEMSNEDTTGRDIMVIKDDHVEREFKTTGIRLTNFKRRPRISSYAGYGAGSKAGDNVNLSRPLENGPSTLMIT